MLQTSQEVLEWYCSKPRVLTPEAIEGFPWDDAARYPLEERLVEPIVFVSHIEIFTDLYYEELLRTVTAQDPAVRTFMDRWRSEEPTHGEVLMRFLAACGVAVSPAWRQEAFDAIPAAYRRESLFAEQFMNALGRRVIPLHMTWGAANEYSALAVYRRLAEETKHPLLRMIARAIMREEARHALFYADVARIHLARDAVARIITRLIMRYAWTPVGEGTKTRRETDQVISTLFAGSQGVAYMDRHVTSKIRLLPGFGGFTRITDRIREAVLSAP